MWCLGDGLSHYKLEHLLNVETLKKLSFGENSYIGVELVFGIGENLYYFRRELNIKKNFDGIKSDGENYYINGVNHEFSEYISRIDEILPFYHLVLSIFDFGYDQKKFYLMLKNKVLQYVKNEEFLGIIFEKIEKEANEIFAKLYKCNSNCKILFDYHSGLKTLLYENDNWVCYDPSITLQAIVNISVALATCRVLEVSDSPIPLIIDDTFRLVNKKVFSINEVIAELFPKQTIILLHESNLDLFSDRKEEKIGKFYSMVRTVDCTNVKIEEFQ